MGTTKRRTRACRALLDCRRWRFRTLRSWVRDLIYSDPDFSMQTEEKHIKLIVAYYKRKVPASNVSKRKTENLSLKATGD